MTRRKPRNDKDDAATGTAEFRAVAEEAWKLAIQTIKPHGESAPPGRVPREEAPEASPPGPADRASPPRRNRAP